MINVSKNKITTFNFKETNFDLSNFFTKSITHRKIQERNSFEIISCIYNYYLKKITYNVKFNNQKFKHIYKKNSLGFRGEEIDSNELKFLMMGGSTTNERFTPEDLTIVGILNSLFLKRPSIFSRCFISFIQ